MTAKFVRLLLMLVLAALSVGGMRTIYRNNSQNIAMKPLSLDPAHPGVRRVDELIFLQAWELGSDNSDFGGISALAALPDGRFLGVSDAGTLIGFGLTTDDRTDRPFIAPLPEAQGPGKDFRDRDSEGIAYDTDSGQFWVSYEQRHAIRRFSRSFARVNGVVHPPEMREWSANKGTETLVRLRDGRFIAIGETLEEDKHPALLFSGDPVEPGTAITHFRYQPPAGYRVTDGSALPDGRLLLLHREIAFPTGFAAKLAIIEPSAIAGDQAVKGRVIATLAPPLLVDNMEGVAITREGHDVIIWVISDNNFNIWQRTLLMKFKLSERRQKKKPEASPAPGFDSF